MHVRDAFPWIGEAGLPLPVACRAGPLQAAQAAARALPCKRGEAGGRTGQHTPLHGIHTVKQWPMQHCAKCNTAQNATQRSQLLQQRHGLWRAPNLGQRAREVVAVEREDRELWEGAGGAPLHWRLRSENEGDARTPCDIAVQAEAGKTQERSREVCERHRLLQHAHSSRRRQARLACSGRVPLRELLDRRL